MNPMFSVIVPIYKVEEFIKKCIDSVLEQTYGDFELILVDDGSPDNCPKICDEYRKMDARVIVIHKENGGLVSARNTGLLKSKGKYILCLDGDDWLKSDALEIVYNKAIKNYSPDVIITNMTKVWSDGKQEEIPCLVPEKNYNKEELIEQIYPYMMWDSRKRFYKGLVFPSAGGKIISRQILINHYCTNEKIRMGEDNAYIYECIYNANSVFFCKNHIYMYTQSNESMARGYDATRFENNKILIEYIESHLKGKEEYIDKQINSFKAYWLIMAIFHEMRCRRKLLDSRKHIKKSIYSTSAIDGIQIKNLPFFPKMYVILLRMHFYLTILILSKIVLKFHK